VFIFLRKILKHLVASYQTKKQTLWSRVFVDKL